MGYFSMRIASIAVELNVSSLYRNMYAAAILECFGNILCLCAITIIAYCWSAILRVPGAKKIRWVSKILKRALWIGWVVVSVCLIGFLIWYLVSLPKNFGVTAHDGTLRVNSSLSYIIGPTPQGTMEKPQTGIIMANRGLHYAFMCQKGMYTTYGFLMGVIFVVFCVLILFVMNTIRQGQGKKVGPEFRLFVFKVLIVAFGVMSSLAVIFIFAVLEISTHRHGLRFEYYVTNYLAAEIVTFGVLLWHYWSAELRAKAREKLDRQSHASTLSSGSLDSVPSPSTSMAASMDPTASGQLEL
jgi:hypothetical protein